MNFLRGFLMELTLSTITATDRSTEGMLDIEGLFECYTLELPYTDGAPGGAIPAGERFRIYSAPSPHFQSVAAAGDDWFTPYADQMPHIEIPGRTLIMFHPGDFVRNTKGCVLVGRSKGIDVIGSSRPAFAQLYGKIYQPMIDGNCFLTVTR